ncbi:MAG: KH domain-containing protein [Clostridia bacterium]|nr:KH domain-containing protein [Clostridia bacterium]MBR5315100.1 KH domain-containing protein [Clostridia bacterium]
MKQILTDIAKSIVDEPDEVTVIQNENGNSVVLTLSVASQDMGKVIGRNGRIAKAIRTVMKAAANADGKKVTVEIR